MIIFLRVMRIKNVDLLRDRYQKEWVDPFLVHTGFKLARNIVRDLKTVKLLFRISF